MRHGQTPANAAGLIQGQGDPDLTDLGRRQAAELAGHVPAGATVLSSPLKRAIQTAEALGLPAGVVVEVDPRWTEIHFGVLEDQPVSEVRRVVWPAWDQDPEWAPEGGESLAAVSRRVAAACDELAPRLAAADIVVVTHVSPIKAAVAWALGVEPGIAGRMFVDLASVTTIAVGAGGSPVLRSYNEGAFPRFRPGVVTAPPEPGTGGRAGSAG